MFCVQETKCDIEKIPSELNIDGYHTYWLSGDTEGYSGVGMYTKEKPINVTYGIGETNLYSKTITQISLWFSNSACLQPG